MPFTPYHLGPGMAFKAVLPEKFSLMVYGWSQVVMDIQPLIAIASGEAVWHGWTHTLAGAAGLGLVAAASGKYLAEWGVRLITLGRRKIQIRWKAALLSSLIGSFSHILIDGFLHHDMQPFWPILSVNPLLAFGVSFEEMQLFCLVCGAIGIIIYLLRRIVPWKKKKGIRGKRVETTQV